MKKYLLLLSILPMMLMTINCNSGKKGENDEQKLSAAKDLDKKYEDAFNKGSSSAIMDTYWNSPELVSYSLIASGADSSNWKASKLGWFNTFDVVKGATITLTNVKNKVEGELVLGWGNWQIKDSTGTSKGQGFYTNIKTKRGGKWVYIMDDFSDNRLHLLDRLN